MPVIARSPEGKVVSLWGTALIRGADGKLRLLKVGDVVRQGDQILTTQDGIVQIDNGEAPVKAAEGKALAGSDDVEQAITALNRGDSDAAPAAGLTGGGDGSMQEGLRVDRISESAGSAEVPRSTGDAELRVTDAAGSTGGNTANQGGTGLPPLDVPSSAISTAEEGAPANLGLTAPAGDAAGGTVLVDQVPAVGEIRKADGTLVTAGAVLTPADLPGLSYVPPADYDGALPPGGFSYTLTTPEGRSASGGTTIALSAVNDAPVATPAAGAGDEDAMLPISLGGADVDGRIVGVTVTSLPVGGTLWLADGVTPVGLGQTLSPADAAALLYRPGADFNGSQSIQFTVTDNAGATSAPATVALTVVAVNDIPVALDDSARTVGQAPVRIDVLANDRDIDGDPLAVTAARVDPALGSVTVNGDGSLTFAAAPGVTGPVTVRYEVADPSGATSAATLTIDVAAGPSVTVDAPALTGDATPTINGSSNLPAGAIVTVAVTDASGATQTFTATVTAAGSYSVEVPSALAEGGYGVVASVADAFGNAASASDTGTIDLTAPSLIVSAPATTNDPTPTITGTTDLPAGSAVGLVVTDARGTVQLFTATVAAGGSFVADVPAALAEGPFTVVATAADPAGNSVSANDAGAIDLTAPSLTVDAPALTGDATPTITGTSDLPAGSIVSLVVTDASGLVQNLSATVAAGGTYSVDVPTALAEGAFTVVAAATDSAGNPASANDAGSVDVTAPTITVDVPPLTNDATPTITGTTDLPTGSTVTLMITDASGLVQNLTATVAAGGTYSIDVPAALAEGSFTVAATATDAAGNSASANDAGAIDLTAPSVTVDAPALTSDATPTITGTSSLPAGSSVALVVTDANGVVQNLAATVTAGGTYSIDVPSGLAEGAFTVVATATDTAGNSASANDAGAIDLTAPTITVDAPSLTNDATPTITGTSNLLAGSTVSLVVTDANGVVQNLTATVAAGGTYAIDVPTALAEGAFTVVASATDAAGNSASANDAGSVDVTGPTITVDAPALTNDATPTISGSTDLPAGSTVALVVTDANGVVQNLTATVAAGGTYAIDVPAALAEGNFTVAATVTDAAGNSASANDAGAIDLTAPTVTVSAAALTNDATPTITGTTDLPAGATVSLVVTDANGAVQNLTATVVAGGTYSIDVPTALAEGGFTIVATATDAAGNSGSANDAGSVDVTAPTITVDVPSLTNDATPTITGTTDLPTGSSISIAVTGANGVVQNLTATVAAGGTYAIDVPAALAEGSFTVVATVTDAAGNSASANDAGAIDLTAPSVTVDAPALTNDATPTITGTTNLSAGSTVSLVVTDANGAVQNLTATVTAGGTYAIDVPTALAEGAFTVVASATDAAGNSASANDAGSVDVTGPTITVDAPSLTNDATPAITGTTDLPTGSTVALVVTDANGVVQTLSATVAAGGTYAIDVPAALAEGNFTVAATATDAAGNSASANDAGAIDLTAPTVTVNAAALTNDATPTITGTTDLPADSTVSLVVTDANGAVQNLTATVVAGGTYSIDVPTALAEGGFTVVATATDAAGNSGSANDAGAIDLTAPTISVDAPALTNDATPPITGTTSLQAGSTVSLVVTDANGVVQNLTAAVVAGGTYAIDVPVALAEGNFTVVATAIDAAGNSASANDAGAIDLTAPLITVDAPTLANDATLTITGTTNLPTGSSLTLVVTDANGVVQNLTATVAAGGTYAIDVPAALAEGAFTVVATATDAAGNSASANDAGAVDLTAPTITVDAPSLTNDATPAITGTTDLPTGSTVALVVTDANGVVQTLTATVVAGGTYSVDVPAALAEGNFTVAATVTDAAGNSASANDAGAIDLTAPSMTVDAPALTNDATPTIIGTTNLPTGSSLTLVVTDANGVVQNLTATVAAGGTYAIDVPAALAEGAFTVVVTATDAAGNSATANDAGAIDLTAPTITVDAPSLTKDATPTITGTTDLPAGSTVSLVITDASGAVQSLAASVASGGIYTVDVPAALAEGNFTVVATAIDAAGNSASAADAGAVDTGAPVVTLSLEPVTADNVLSAAEAGGSVLITGQAGGEAAAGDTVVLTIAGQAYQATVGMGGGFSVSVPGSALAADADSRIDASLTITDAAGNSSTATASQTYGVNTPPAGADATVTTAEDTAYTFSAADFGHADADGQALVAVRIDSLPAAGQLLLSGAAVAAGQQIAAADLVHLRFVPAPDANGIGYASFSFSVSDGIDFDPTPRQLTIDVTPVNDAPAAQPGAFTVAEDAAAITGAVTATDSDAGATLSFALNGAAPAGLTFNANGSYSFDPSVAAYQSLAAGQSTVITAPFTVTDNAGATSSAALVITVTGTNDTPVAVADTGALDEDTTLTVTAATGVLANDSDADAGDSRTVSAVSFGATAGTVGAALAGHYGTLTLNADGSYTYAADGSAAHALAGGQVATESFSYTVRDAAGATASTALTFTITGTDDAPTITGPLSASVQEDTTLSATGTLLITDPDAGQSSFVAQSGTPGLYGSFSITAAGVWSYALNNAAPNVQALPGGAAPTETFVVQSADGTSRSITITVNGTNDPAAIAAGSGAVTEDVAVSGGNLVTGGTLVVSDVDAGQAAFQPQAATAGAYGTFTLAADGAWTYTAANTGTAIQSLGAGQTLSETFSVRSLDGTVSTVTVTIFGTNDGAVISGATSGSVTEDTAVTNGNLITGGTLTVTDVDSGQASFQPQSSTAGTYGTFALAADGAWTYTASNASTAIQSLGVGQSVTDTFTVRSADGTASTVTVTIHGTNDAPVANSNTGPAIEDTTLTIVPATLLSNDTDVDSGSTLSIVSVQSPVNGSVAMVGGNIVFTPTANHSGPASFTYTISDGQGGASTATVNLNVAAVADAPTLAIGAAPSGGTPPSMAGLPASTGLVRAFYDNVATVGSNNAGNIATVEANIEATTPTSTAIANDIAVPDIGVDDAYRYTGYIYLQAGQTYQIAGSRDDTLMVKIGGSSVYSVGFNNWGAFTASGFTPSVSGFYSLEVIAYNGDGVGNLDINMSVNGGPSVDLNTSNFRLYGSATDFTATPAVAGTLVPNNDGGYFPGSILGDEDTSIRLGPITAALTDTDGSETLSLHIGAIPVGATISDGVNSFTATAGNTTANVTGWALNNLSLTPPANFSGSIALTVTATATEAAGPSASTVGTMNVIVSPVADAPAVAGETAIVTVGLQNTATVVNLPLLATLVDNDGSETLSVIVSGVPTGATLSAGTNTGAGTWTLTAEQLAGVTMTLPSNYEPGAAATLTVTAVSTETATGQQASVSQTITLYADATDFTTNGTAGADTLNPNNNDRFINAFGGDDTVNAGSGDDLVRGDTGNDTIRGNNGNDALYGDASNDVIVGGAGRDLIVGGAGDDTLTGGTGTAGVTDSTTDVFAWSLADRGSAGAPAVDTITDFNAAAVNAGGDVLDLRDLLTGEALGAGNSVGNLANYLDFQVSGSGASATTTIRISSTGGFADGNYAPGAEDQTIVLQGVDLPGALGLAGGASDAQIVQELINRGKLIVDSVGS